MAKPYRSRVQGLVTKDAYEEDRLNLIKITSDYDAMPWLKTNHIKHP